MTNDAGSYSKGDWLVHCYHGLGRVKGVESKKINGEKAKYYRVEADDSIFWVPVEAGEDSRVRPITSRRRLKRALKELTTTPKKMSDAYQKRQQRIKAVKKDGSIDAICGIIRDLTARRRDKNLNENEKRALSFFKTLLLREWSISADVTQEDARKELGKILRSTGALAEESS